MIDLLVPQPNPPTNGIHKSRIGIPHHGKKMATRSTTKRSSNVDDRLHRDQNLKFSGRHQAELDDNPFAFSPNDSLKIHHQHAHHHSDKAHLESHLHESFLSIQSSDFDVPSNTTSCVLDKQKLSESSFLSTLDGVAVVSPGNSSGSVLSSSTSNALQKKVQFRELVYEIEPISRKHYDSRISRWYSKQDFAFFEQMNRKLISKYRETVLRNVGPNPTLMVAAMEDYPVVDDEEDDEGKDTFVLDDASVESSSTLTSTEHPGAHYCLRGLENMMSVRAKLSHHHRFKDYQNAVFSEQKRCRAEKCGDITANTTVAESIRLSASAVSKTSRLIALNLAQQDARDARKYQRQHPKANEVLKQKTTIRLTTENISKIVRSDPLKPQVNADSSLSTKSSSTSTSASQSLSKNDNELSKKKKKHGSLGKFLDEMKKATIGGSISGSIGGSVISSWSMNGGKYKSLIKSADHDTRSVQTEPIKPIVKSSASKLSLYVPPISKKPLKMGKIKKSKSQSLDPNVDSTESTANFSSSTATTFESNLSSSISMSETSNTAQYDDDLAYVIRGGIEYFLERDLPHVQKGQQHQHARSVKSVNNKVNPSSRPLPKIVKQGLINDRDGECKVSQDDRTCYSETFVMKATTLANRAASNRRPPTLAGSRSVGSGVKAQHVFSSSQPGASSSYMSPHVVDGGILRKKSSYEPSDVCRMETHQLKQEQQQRRRSITSVNSFADQYDCSSSSVTSYSSSYITNDVSNDRIQI